MRSACPHLICRVCLQQLEPCTCASSATPSTSAGDFIDEDTQQVRSGGDPGASGGDVAPAVTNSSWRMYKWMRDYSQLMRCAAAVGGGCWRDAQPQLLLVTLPAANAGC